jgi:hypothetical protein
MKAHIDLLKDQIANAVTEHEALGCTDNPFNTGAAWPREGSPADAMNLELLDLINKDSKSSIELKPKGTEDAKKSDKSKTIEPSKKDDK